MADKRSSTRSWQTLKLAAGHSPVLQAPVSWLRLRYSLLLLTQLIVFLVFPFWMDTNAGVFIMVAFVTLTPVAGVYSLVPADRKMGTALTLPTIVLVSFAVISASDHVLLAACIVGAICISYLISKIFWHALQIERVSLEKVQGSLAVFFLIGLAWALIYSILELERPGSFALGTAQSYPPDRFDTVHIKNFAHLLFHSYMTLCATSYGAVAAKTAPALALTALETLIGQIYMAILVAQLMGLHLAFHRDTRGSS